MVNWAAQIGPHTAKLFERILAEKPHPEMGYRSCLGIIRLAEEYSPTRMEAAADRAVRTGACRYQSDQQWDWRQNQALTRRVLAARLRGTACVENIDYRAERGLNRSVIRALAQESSWVANHEHIFVLGPTGVGKSYVASALAQKACRDGYRRTTRGPRRCSGISAWHAPMAVCGNC